MKDFFYQKQFDYTGQTNYKPRKRKENVEINYLTKKETTRFFEAIEKSNNKFKLRDLLAFNIIYLCGLRASELKLIKLSDFNKETGDIYIRRLKGSNPTTLNLYRIQRTINIKNLFNRYLKEYSGKELYQINGDEDFLFKGKN